MKEIQLATTRQQVQSAIKAKTDLTDSIKTVMLRVSDVPFRELSTEEQTVFITTEMEKARMRAYGGQSKPNEETEVFTITELVDLFSTRMPCTLAEISYFFQKGSAGMYGEFFGINVKTVCSWYSEYMDEYEPKYAKQLVRDLTDQINNQNKR